jgi:hypothetical protein
MAILTGTSPAIVVITDGAAGRGGAPLPTSYIETWSTVEDSGWPNTTTGMIWNYNPSPPPVIFSCDGVLGIAQFPLPTGSSPAAWATLTHAIPIDLTLRFAIHMNTGYAGTDYLAGIELFVYGSGSPPLVGVVLTAHSSTATFDLQILGTTETVTSVAPFTDSSPQTFYRTRLRIEAAMAYAKVWRDSDAEPASWQITASLAVSTVISRLYLTFGTTASLAVFSLDWLAYTAGT